MRTRGPIQSEGVKRIPAKQLELVFQILCDWQDIVWWKVFCWLGPDVSCLSYSWIFPLLNAYVLLESFQKSFLNLKFPKSPERGNFDLREALESPYSFNYSRHLLSLSTESMTAW